MQREKKILQKAKSKWKEFDKCTGQVNDTLHEKNRIEKKYAEE